MATSKRGKKKNSTAVNSRKKLPTTNVSDISKIFAERDIEVPIRKIKVKIRTTKRLTQDVKEFMLDGHTKRKNAVILKYSPIEPPKRYIGRLKRKPQPFRWA